MAFEGGASQFILEAMAAAARRRLVVGVEAVGEAALQRRLRVAMRLGSMGSFGLLGSVRRCARAGIVVVQADRFYAVAQLLLLQRGIALGLYLGLAFAVGRLCLLEDVDDVLGLGPAVSGYAGVLVGEGTTYATDNLARAIDDGDGLSYAHGGQSEEQAQANAGREMCSGTFDRRPAQRN